MPITLTCMAFLSCDAERCATHDDYSERALTHGIGPQDTAAIAAAQEKARARGWLETAPGFWLCPRCMAQKPAQRRRSAAGSLLESAGYTMVWPDRKG